MKKKLLIASFVIIAVIIGCAIYWFCQKAPILVFFKQGTSSEDASKVIAECVFGGVISRPASGTDALIVQIETNRFQRIIADRCLPKNADVDNLLDVIVN